jgi:lantibiotic modifying enzyme
MTLLKQRTSRPILIGAEAEEAIHIACQIADVLAATPIPGAQAADVALFLAYLDGVRPDRGYIDRADALLDDAIAHLADEDRVDTGFGLYAGFLGPAWTMEHLAGRCFDVDGDPNESLDEPLLALLRRSPWEFHFDLMTGLTGMGVYALERLDRGSGTAMISAIVARLAELTRADGPGRTILTEPHLLLPEHRSVYPRGHHDLGVAHGIAGVIGLLAACIEARALGADAHALLADLVRWLLAQRGDVPGARFDYYVMDGVGHRGSRTAWCYGNPGIAAALLWAARVTDNAEWERDALELARGSLRRPYAETGVVDVTICHGSAGLAHVYNRLFQATGDPSFAAGARLWLADATHRRRIGEGLAGFGALWTNAQGEPEWRTDPGFLVGAAGVGLAYLAAASDVEPEWDRKLLATIPPRA